MKFLALISSFLFFTSNAYASDDVRYNCADSDTVLELKFPRNCAQGCDASISIQIGNGESTFLQTEKTIRFNSISAQKPKFEATNVTFVDSPSRRSLQVSLSLDLGSSTPFAWKDEVYSNEVRLQHFGVRSLVCKYVDDSKEATALLLKKLHDKLSEKYSNDVPGAGSLSLEYFFYHKLDDQSLFGKATVGYISTEEHWGGEFVQLAVEEFSIDKNGVLALKPVE